MKIFVCVKHVPDSAVNITLASSNQIDENITFLMNPYDEHAVEAAVRLKERFEDVEVVAVTLGKEGALNTLRTALAMGADRGVFIPVESSPDGIQTAKLLAAAIDRENGPDIILTGKESIDSVGMQTAFRIGAILDMPVVTNTAALDLDWDAGRPHDQNRVMAECEKGGGDRDVFEIIPPCVIGAGKGLNEPRYPTLPHIMKARKKEIKTVEPSELGVDAPPARTEVLKLHVAEYDRKKRILTGSTPRAVSELINCLRDEERVI